jgi:hypothetical protein
MTPSKVITMAKSAAATSDKVLAKEYETFKDKLPELAAQEGKFVLIHDDQVGGIFSTYEEALLAGYKKFGVKQPFLVKQIVAAETPVFLP